MEEENNCPCVLTKKSLCEQCLTMTPVEGGCLFESSNGESCVVGPSDGNDISTFSAEFTEGVLVGTHGSATGNVDVYTPVTTLTNVDSVYTYTNENGDEVSFNLCQCMPTVTESGTVYTWTPGDGTSPVQWDTADVVTTLVENADGSFTYTSEDGTITDIPAPPTIDVSTLTQVTNPDGTQTVTHVAGGVTQVVTIPASQVITTLLGNPDGSFTYTSEDGTTTVIPAPTQDVSTLTPVTNADGSQTITHIAGGITQTFNVPSPVDMNDVSTLTQVTNPDGSVTVTHVAGGVTETFNIPAPTAGNTSVVTSVNNPDGTITYTHDDGTGTTQSWTTSNPSTLVETVNANGTKDYTHTNGLGVQQDFCTGIPIQDEDGNTGVLDCNDLYLDEPLAWNIAHGGATAPAGNFITVQALYSMEEGFTGITTIEDKVTVGSRNSAVTGTRGGVYSSDGSTASGTNSAVIAGDRSTASGADSFATGQENLASGQRAFVAGVRNQSIGFNSFVAGGADNVVAATQGFAAGQRNEVVAGAGSSGAIGSANILDSLTSFAAGSNNESHGDANAMMFGSGNLVDGLNSSGMGTANVVPGNNSHGKGENNVITGQYCTAVGFNNTILDNRCHTQGTGNTVNAGSINTFIKGRNGTAQGDDIHLFAASAGVTATQNNTFIIDNMDVGVDITTPTERLHVNGNGLFTGTITPSDEKLKENITKVETKAPTGAEVISANWNKENDPYPEGHPHHGRENIMFSAQELEKIDPRLVIEEYTMPQVKRIFKTEKEELIVGYEMKEMKDDEGNKFMVFDKEKPKIKNIEKPVYTGETEVIEAKPTGRKLIQNQNVMAYMFDRIVQLEAQVKSLTK